MMSTTTLAELKQEAADLQKTTFIRKDLGGGRFAVSVTSQADVERLHLLNAQIEQMETVSSVPPSAASPVAATTSGEKSAYEAYLEAEIAELRTGMVQPAAETVTRPARRSEAQLAAQFDQAIAANVQERFAHQKPGGRS